MPLSRKLPYGRAPRRSTYSSANTSVSAPCCIKLEEGRNDLTLSVGVSCPLERLGLGCSSLGSAPLRVSIAFAVHRHPHSASNRCYSRSSRDRIDTLGPIATLLAPTMHHESCRLLALILPSSKGFVRCVVTGRQSGSSRFEFRTEI